MNQLEITKNGFCLKNKKSINSLLINELSAPKPNHLELNKFRAGVGLGGPKPLLPTYIVHYKSVFSLQAQFGRRKENSIRIQESGAIAKNRPGWPRFILAFVGGNCLGLPNTNYPECFRGCWQRCKVHDAPPIGVQSVFGQDNGDAQLIFRPVHG